MTFVHQFNRTLRVTVCVADDPPVNGEHFIQHVEWSTRPKSKHYGEYLRWCHEVYSHLASRWDLRLMQVIQASRGRWEIWA